MADLLSCGAARELASDYLDGDLDPGTAAALEDHLKSCTTCPPLVAALIGVIAELGSLPPVTPSPAWVAHLTSRAT